MMRQNPSPSGNRCLFPRRRMYQRRRLTFHSRHCIEYSYVSDLRISQGQDSVIGQLEQSISKICNLPSQYIDPFRQEYAQYRYY